MKTKKLLSALMMLLMSLSVHAVTTVISYELQDSWGDGWNGASISVVDAETGQEWASLAIASGNSSEGTFALISGRTYNFIWNKGSYDSECSFTFTDAKGNVFLTQNAGSPISDGTLLTYMALMKGDVNADGKVSITDAMDELKCVLDASVQEETGDVEIRYELRDQCNDGWDGASILVYDTDAESELEKLTLSDNGFVEGTLALAAGHTYQFEWIPGSFDNECSFILYDSEGVVLFRWPDGEETEHGSVLFEYQAPNISSSASSVRDLNDDGNVNITDVMMIVNYVANGIPVPDLELSCESVDLLVDSKISISITAGSGNYEAVSSDPEKLKIIDGALSFSLFSQHLGTYVVTVKDMDTGQTKELQVTVKEAEMSCPDSNHPHMIDLGLPSGTKWACCNVDATAPESYGGYYAWGETAEKDDYSWSTYIHSGGSEGTCHNLGTSINGTQYDVAHAKWGDTWYMPSRAQSKELFINTSYVQTSMNGVKGVLFTGSNGNSIFVPDGGWKEGTEINGMQSDESAGGGYFWEGTPHSDHNQAYFVNLLSLEEGGADYNYSDGADRYLGYNVRPVSTEAVPLSVSCNNVEIASGESTAVEITAGSGNYIVGTSNVNVATVTIDGNMVNITAVGGGSTTITISDTQTGKSIAVSVTVPSSQVPYHCPDDHHPHMIDLGLPSGTKWACCNVGADKPDSDGSFYAWGETEVKENYLYDNYAHYRADGFEGGADEEDAGFGDRNHWRNLGESISGTEFDVAYVNWGNKWQMPSDSQFEELLNNCVSETVTMDNQVGVNLTGPNGNIIFLPLSGYVNGGLNEGKEDGGTGYYWSGNNYYPEESELEWNEEDSVYSHMWGDFSSCYHIDEDGGHRDVGIPRYFGLSVRPVYHESGSLCPDDHHPHMIDLGLPSGTKWACCNVGADMPEADGSYFAWGETKEKEQYRYDNYEHYSVEGFGDAQDEVEERYRWRDLGESISGTEFDAAYVNWGNSWWMPSKVQIEEMLDNCSYEPMMLNGVAGVQCTGPNGNSIFLPYTEIVEGNEKHGIASDEEGYYWSGDNYYPEDWELDDGMSERMWGDYSSFFFVYPEHGSYDKYMPRYYGATVRPVYHEYTPLKFSAETVEIEVLETATVTILDGNGDYGICDSSPLVFWYSFDGTTLSITGTHVSEGYIEIMDNVSGEKAKVFVKVTESHRELQPICPDDHHPHMIDLGLPSGTMWACCNVDTEHPENQSPTNYGGYYALGEIEEKSVYDESTYTHYDQESNTWEELGDFSGTNNDVAHMRWGETWLMPSSEQMDEMLNTCAYEWKNINGVDGGLFTGKNGSSIFIPAAGYRSGTSLEENGEWGYCWGVDQNNNPYYIYLNSDEGWYGFNGGDRVSGRSVRPIATEIPVPHLQLSESSVSLSFDEGYTVEILSGSGSYTVEIDEETVAEVNIEDNKIYITPREGGSATITVSDTETGETATIQLSIDMPPTPFSLSEEILALEVGETAKVYPNDGCGEYNVVSSDESVATVEVVYPQGDTEVDTGVDTEVDTDVDTEAISAEGIHFLITAAGPGTATITVTDTQSGQTATVEVTVKKPLQLTPNELTLVCGEDVSVSVSDGSGDYTAESSNENVATVEVVYPQVDTEIDTDVDTEAISAEGIHFLITAAGPGTATITVTDTQSGQTATVEVTVKKTLQLTPNELTLVCGEDVSVSVSDGSGDYTAESSNENVVTVSDVDNANGDNVFFEVHAVNTGTATITVTDTESGETATVEVTVTQ